MKVRNTSAEPTDAELASLASRSRELTAEMVELQASLMRRWIRATAEWRRGDCTDEEYEAYLVALRNVARKAAQENDPLYGASPRRRAQAYAHPLVLGKVGTGLSAVHVSFEAGVEVPHLPHPSEWILQRQGVHHKTVEKVIKHRDWLRTFSAVPKSAHPWTLRK